jgi:hypothetical protein
LSKREKVYHQSLSLKKKNGLDVTLYTHEHQSKSKKTEKLQSARAKPK